MPIKEITHCCFVEYVNIHYFLTMRTQFIAMIQTNSFHSFPVFSNMYTSQSKYLNVTLSAYLFTDTGQCFKTLLCSKARLGWSNHSLRQFNG